MARRSKKKKNRSKHERAHREKAICIETYSNISECERINNKTSIIPISFNWISKNLNLLKDSFRLSKN